jgi:hypothetical protein
VYNQKRDDLIGTLDSKLSPLFEGQLKNLREAVLVSFKEEILASLANVMRDKNFISVVSVVSEVCVGAEARFSEGAREAVVTEGDPTWQWEEELRLLQEDIRSFLKVCNSRSNE